MAKKRFTFADAKEKIKELEAELAKAHEAAKLDDSDNIYTSHEMKYIKLYKYSAWLLYILIGIKALVLIF